MKFLKQMVVSLILLVSTTTLAFADEELKAYNGDIKDSMGFYAPYGISYSNKHGIVVADFSSNMIKAIKEDKVTTLYDDKSKQIIVNNPADIAVSSNGSIYVCVSGENVIKKLDSQNKVTVVAGEQKTYGFNRPVSIAFDKADNLYVSDSLNHVIKKIDKNGDVTVFAGSAKKSGFRDGSAGAALFNEPSGIFVDEDNTMYVADSANHAIRRIRDGQVSTVAGASYMYNDETGYPEGGYIDGTAADAMFNFPKDVCVVRGVIYVADTYNNVIRMIDKDMVTTVLGSGEAKKDYSSFNNVKLNKPNSVFVKDNTMYIGDTNNNTVVSIPLKFLNIRMSRTDIIAFITNFNEPIVYVNNVQLDGGLLQAKRKDDKTYVKCSYVFPALGYQFMTSSNDDVHIVNKDGKIAAVFSEGDDLLFENNVYMVSAESIAKNLNIRMEWFPEKNLLVFLP